MILSMGDTTMPRPLRLAAILLASLLFIFAEFSSGQSRQIMRQDDDYASANELREGETIVKIASHPDSPGDYYHITVSRLGLVTVTLTGFPSEGTFHIDVMGFDPNSPTGWIPNVEGVVSKPGDTSLQLKFNATKGTTGYIRIAFDSASGLCSGNDYCAMRLTPQGPWYLTPIRDKADARIPSQVDGVPLLPKLSYRLTATSGDADITGRPPTGGNPPTDTTYPPIGDPNRPTRKDKPEGWPPESTSTSNLIFEDTFQRPDSQSLGPQWREYQLRNNQVRMADTPFSLQNRELYFEYTGTGSYIEDFIETVDTFPVNNLRIEFELRGRVGTHLGYVGPTFLLSGDAMQRTNSANVASGPSHIGLHTSYRWEKQGQKGAVILANGTKVHDLPDAVIGGLNENSFQPHTITIANNSITYSSPQIGTVTYPLDVPLTAGERRHFTIGTRVYDPNLTQILEIRNLRIYSLNSNPNDPNTKGDTTVTTTTESALRGGLFPADGKGVMGYPIQIKVVDTGLPPQCKFIWTWGDGSSDEINRNKESSHQYSGAGDFTASFTVLDPNTNSIVSSQSFKINIIANNGSIEAARRILFYSGIR
jgi:hypothetical protein